MGHTDAAEHTLAEVEKLSLQEQFALFGERYERSSELLTDAQRQVSDDSWYWLVNGVLPSPGITSYDALQGAKRENSYYISASRSISLPGATGDKADLEPLLSYYASEGWEAEILDHNDGTFVARAFTDDHFRIDYQVQANGQYNLTVSSGTFWGDYPALLSAISERIPDTDLLEASPPGTLTPFPTWDSPIVHS